MKTAFILWVHPDGFLPGQTKRLFFRKIFRQVLQGLKLSEITYAAAARVFRENTQQDLPLTEAQFKEAISAEHMVYGRKGAGGPQLPEVERMLAHDRAKLMSDTSWLNCEKGRLAAAESSLDTAVVALANRR